MIWHKLRGHKILAFKVLDSTHPWRWQCSCTRIFGGKEKR